MAILVKSPAGILVQQQDGVVIEELLLVGLVQDLLAAAEVLVILDWFEHEFSFSNLVGIEDHLLPLQALELVPLAAEGVLENPVKGRHPAHSCHHRVGFIATIF